jgi:hypothetical protein
LRFEFRFERHERAIEPIRIAGRACDGLAPLGQCHECCRFRALAPLPIWAQRYRDPEFLPENAARDQLFHRIVVACAAAQDALFLCRVTLDAVRRDCLS